MSKTIIFNWKMNPATEQEAVSLAQASDAAQAVIAPPFPFLKSVAATVKKAALAGQDISAEEKGAFTGQVSAGQLKSFGVSCVIAGHSEKRRLGDTDELIAKKLAIAVRHGLIPVLCVGENRSDHDAGRAEAVVEKQLEKDLSIIHNSKFINQKIIIAYEPVWSISTEPGAQPDTPENAIAMISFIKKSFAVNSHKSLVISYFYGGSVTSANAESFLKNKEIEGALVGGASLKQEEIKKILQIAKKY